MRRKITKGFSRQNIFKNTENIFKGPENNAINNNIQQKQTKIVSQAYLIEEIFQIYFSTKPCLDYNYKIEKIKDCAVAIEFTSLTDSGFWELDDLYLSIDKDKENFSAPNYEFKDDNGCVVFKIFCRDIPNAKLLVAKLDLVSPQQKSEITNNDNILRKYVPQYTEDGFLMPVTQDEYRRTEDDKKINNRINKNTKSHDFINLSREKLSSRTKKNEKTEPKKENIKTVAHIINTEKPKFKQNESFKRNIVSAVGFFDLKNKNNKKNKSDNYPSTQENNGSGLPNP